MGHTVTAIGDMVTARHALFSSSNVISGAKRDEIARTVARPETKTDAMQEQQELGTGIGRSSKSLMERMQQQQQELRTKLEASLAHKMAQLGAMDHKLDRINSLLEGMAHKLDLIYIYLGTYIGTTRPDIEVATKS